MGTSNPALQLHVRIVLCTGLLLFNGIIYAQRSSKQNIKLPYLVGAHRKQCEPHRLWQGMGTLSQSVILAMYLS